MACEKIRFVSLDRLLHIAQVVKIRAGSPQGGAYACTHGVQKDGHCPVGTAAQKLRKRIYIKRRI